MRWQGNRESDNVEDRRDDGASGGGGMLPIGGRGLSLGGIVLALLASWILGVNPLTLLGLLNGGGLPQGAPVATQPKPHQAPNDEEARFVTTVLASTEDVWSAVFAQAGKTYEKPTLVLFRGTTPTACGAGEAAMGPFYCPGDRQVYIDLSFYDTLRQQLGAPGDFAQAYVIAHEVGHHVQNLLGITGKVDALRARQGEAQANATSVRVELQADCLAGVWAQHAQAQLNWLEQGDVEEALNAASHIGDDALQQAAQGRVVPESFTHGSSQQRVSWFRRGLSQGHLSDCDTFAARSL
ncbi:neutral zinc metallopeptidase [Ideonella sp. B7]|uniref:KPN_02809 family neutral zinc metallopeptidase n=1 Tax=Ideonella benzenivorans TaxID=2831643 RepID=UPI001CED5A4F|nr:neutral zinc metallopeptidase [Ideonella benzenivorans]MCA6214933.1 neutral zinc metallopeptidase [Ideonella benzenivorans]